jgi:hypothetical protein
MPKTGGGSPTRKAQRAGRAARKRSCRDGRPGRSGLPDRTMGRPVFGVAGERGPRASLPCPLVHGVVNVADAFSEGGFV